ncbi:Gfo/Idh/MocA family protein [Thermocoleostomius sinensis]|uniref:Gfo/Idh/MocA family oxidoreductase n=1 Tax=Thermocoleostomius sinensis A174 TaxID=2016057 RepID=A0A9E9C5D1_9CYAN|nr:Gfo/Idh/MocA family oxidoreductase [Thermocoleostomius sinensis]WAL60991.1 Gfo/Idh/MocA family oxidoreductase [Thermocoleostomius sinensis A174]
MALVRVGLVGTGYAAKRRAEAFQADARSQLVAVAGHTCDKTQAFAQTYAAEASPTWQDLVTRSDIDLVVVANVNREHGRVVRSALQAGKHVVVEYPLTLDVAEAEALVQLADSQAKLLHIEHIELLSGIHQTAKAALPQIGTPFYVRYNSLNSQHPAPKKWTYQSDLFGFPLIGAVSRIHRLVDLFGTVATVNCQSRFWGTNHSESQYTACICTAQLRFVNGLIAEVIYGKGEAIWQSIRSLEIHGEQGGIFVDGDQGTLVQSERTQPLEVGSRRGLFAQDTTMVLDYLDQGTPLYGSIAARLHALHVADAARRSAETQQVIGLESGQVAL